ncbi:MAG: alpha-L-arabinofuranosidase C-terminal domain-containing protein [Lachnospiraceae bacterium]|nr:alpha-L-arabinofuranosidase C-terminal domain-containing protein [Lachnospiraceae bacterium]
MGKTAKLTVHKTFQIGEISELLYGQYFEPLGRCLYEGMYDPKHPTAQKDGFREDIRDLAREMGITCYRYPGGNMSSSYRWEDGVGPRERRPVRMELAWRSIEDNVLGTDECASWVESVGAQSIMTVNMGTRGIEAACDLLEYCNREGGTALSEYRKENGQEKPYGIQYWCIGNELDGPWQIGQKRASDYAWQCREVAKAMKRIDPNLKMIAAGSSSMTMDTYPEWDREVLETGYEFLDGISIHAYLNRKDSFTTSHYLSQINALEEYLKTIEAACQLAKAKNRSSRDLFLSIDEWNVQRYEMVVEKDDYHPNWDVHPPVLEQNYTMEDALLLGLELMTFIKHCNSVKIACMSLLVNALAPIKTRTGGEAWRQTTFYPFAHCAHYARGTLLDMRIECDTCQDEEFGTVALVDAIMTMDGEDAAIFVVNKAEKESVQCLAFLDGFEDYEIVEELEMTHENLFAVNTEEDPDCVVPQKVKKADFQNGMLCTELRPFSWNVIRLKRKLMFKKLEGEV